MEAVVGKRLKATHALLPAALVVVAAAVLLVVELKDSSAGRRLHAPPVVSAAGLEARSGVRVVRVAVSGDGGLLDLRYKVLDANKAQAVHDRANAPLLIDERTGGLVNELLMGHIHSNAPKTGLTYYLLFVNPGNIVRRGSRVTVRLGDARLAHVRVQ